MYMQDLPRRRLLVQLPTADLQQLHERRVPMVRLRIEHSVYEHYGYHNHDQGHSSVLDVGCARCCTHEGRCSRSGRGRFGQGQTKRVRGEGDGSFVVPSMEVKRRGCQGRVAMQFYSHPVSLMLYEDDCKGISHTEIWSSFREGAAGLRSKYEITRPAVLCMNAYKVYV